MFDWFSKPFIEWNIIDSIIAYAIIAIVPFILILCGTFLLILRDKIKEKLGRKIK